MNTNPDQANTSRKLYVALVLNFLLNKFDHNSKLKKSCFDPKGYFYENWLAYIYEIMRPKHPTCTTPLKKKMPSGCSLFLHFGVGRGVSSSFHNTCHSKYVSVIFQVTTDATLRKSSKNGISFDLYSHF